MVPALQVLLLLALLIGAAKAAGALARLARLPAAWGEILLGAAFGPAAFDLWGRLPGYTGQPASRAVETLAVLAQVGLVLSMYLAGLHSPWRDALRLGLPALVAGVGSLVAGVAVGAAAALYLGRAAAEVLLFAAAVSAPGLAVTLATVGETGAVDRDESTVAFAGGLFGQVCAAALLAGALGFGAAGSAAGAGAAALTTLGKAAAYVVAAGLIAAVLAPRLSRWTERWERGAASVWPGWIAALLWAWGAEYLGGLPTAAGAYLMGTVQGGWANRLSIAAQARGLGHTFVFPIFFLMLGMELRFPAGPRELRVALTTATLAVLLRAGGGALALRLGGARWRSALRAGTALAPSGEIGLAVAGAGLAAGAITSDQFALLTVVSVGSSLLVPLLLRWVLPSPT